MLNRNKYFRINKDTSVLIVDEDDFNQTDYRVALYESKLLIVREDEIKIQ